MLCIYAFFSGQKESGAFISPKEVYEHLFPKAKNHWSTESFAGFFNVLQFSFIYKEIHFICNREEY